MCSSVFWRAASHQWVASKKPSAPLIVGIKVCHIAKACSIATFTAAASTIQLIVLMFCLLCLPATEDRFWEWMIFTKKKWAVAYFYTICTSYYKYLVSKSFCISFLKLFKREFSYYFILFHSSKSFSHMLFYSFLFKHLLNKSAWIKSKHFHVLDHYHRNHDALLYITLWEEIY